MSCITANVSARDKFLQEVFSVRLYALISGMTDARIERPATRTRAQAVGIPGASSAAASAAVSALVR